MGEVEPCAACHSHWGWRRCSHTCGARGANCLAGLATIGPLWGDAGIDFGRIVLVVGVLCTLAYFYFTKPQTGALGQISKIGVLFLMLFFGTTFGYTVMSRMSLLIGRLDFLLVEFLRVL